MLYYLNWRMIQAVRGWIGNRFTPAGRFVLAGLALSALIGLDTNQTMSYAVFALLLALLLTSRFCNFFIKISLTAERKLPRFATAGEPLKYRVVLENKSAKNRQDLVLLETIESRPPTYRELKELTGRKRQGPFLAYWRLGQRRWFWLLSRKKPAELKEQALPTLLPDSPADIQVEILPLWRGRLDFKGLTLDCPDPLGLTKTRKRLPLSQSLLVLPKRYPLPVIRLPGTRKHHPGGVTLAASVGESEEFFSLRDYRPGDPMRKIHWKSWARFGKPLVKEFQDEFFVRHALILDTFQPMSFSEKLEEAVSIAASFVAAVETRESLLDLMFVGPEAFCFTSGRGLAQEDKILEILASVQTCTDRTFRALIPAVMERAPLLSGCICIFLEWDDERKQLI
ncbi:MAG: DUF58 domain-containing protein [Desulfobacteraceae bacterium]|nr:MAG: DUF58 domain-containing protein [Desulfobacteraceae bacterium]